ncbi:MAG: hypothetical protein A2536_09240 [Candidatus Firestonebacteria bacterium RIFOXYD2_FULL_39_29]|nr:MAG: hypothetical protein A2536_09240 [Candidatus Firestonebacteria bacterium RIFOXYD2_FULL_39_29]
MPKKKQARISLILTKRERDFLKSFKNKCKNSGGDNLSYGEILRAMVKVFKKLKVKPDNLKNEVDLIKRICIKARIPYK